MATRASKLTEEATTLASLIKTCNIRDEAAAWLHLIRDPDRDPIELMYLVAKICDMLDPGQRADFIATIRSRGALNQAI